MRAIVRRQHGGPEELLIQEVPISEPKLIEPPQTETGARGALGHKDHGFLGGGLESLGSRSFVEWSPLA